MFLKSNGAISLDFGTVAYVNSEAMPALLLGLIENGIRDPSSNVDLGSKTNAEVVTNSAERQDIMEDTTRLTSQNKSYSAELFALKDEVAAAAGLFETLKTENERLHCALRNAQASKQIQGVDKIKESYEKLQKDFQALRAQSAETLSSLKVLESENDELMKHLEHLHNHSKNVPAANSGKPY
jgi:regulator of replication initiation timing